MRATMTLIGLHNYDSTIFDGWTFPEGISKETLIPALLYECSDLELTLPNADLFKIVTNGWCIRKARSWERAYTAMTEQYNPLHNYDRTELTSDLESGSSGHSGEVSGSNTETTAAFNSSSYSPKGKIQTEQDSESSATFGRSFQHTTKVSGNIGVMSSQDMLNQELDVSERLDIYHIIIRDFKREFCLMVY